MSDWQSNFFRENWTRAFWKRDLNHVCLHFEGHRDVLLVGFDSEFSNNTSANWTPWGSVFAQAQDVNYLGFSSIKSTWYLEPWVTEQIASLVEDGFFDRFSRVVFAGHSMGGYGALQFSALVPGAHVAAFSPQTSLEEDRAPFDTRYPQANRLPWQGDSTDAAMHRYDPMRSFVFYDPYLPEDAEHAARLQTVGAQLLRSYHSNHGSLVFLNRMGIATEIMRAICFDSFTPEDFYALFRHRRTMPWFRKSLEGYFKAKNRPEMLLRIARAHEQIDYEKLMSRHQPQAKAVL
jgi:pimeloyl-ACP methyl ester carboxylesterase